MHIQVIEIFSFDELKEKILNIIFNSKESVDKKSNEIKFNNKNTLILLDIDDTLITPRANIFRHKNNPYFPFIDNLKKNKSFYPNFIEILSHWRLNRKAILTHDEWPSFIQELKKKSIVFGLTHMETGSFGQIQKMEEWRINELHEKKIIFSNLLEDTILISDHQGYGAIYKGIIMTGPFTKSQVLSVVLKKLNINQSLNIDNIIMIDDRIEQLNAIANLAKALNFNFMGIHYRAVENLPGEVNKEIAELQKKYLLEECKWVEDEDIILPPK